MKRLQEYIYEALIKKTSIINRPIIEDIYDHFALIDKKYLKDGCKEDFLNTLKDGIKEWVNKNNVKNIDGPYIYSSSGSFETSKLLNYLYKNHKEFSEDYHEMDYNEVSKRLNTFNDYYEDDRIMPEFGFYFTFQNSPFLIGTSKKISITFPGINHSVIIYFKK